MKLNLYTRVRYARSCYRSLLILSPLPILLLTGQMSVTGGPIGDFALESIVVNYSAANSGNLARLPYPSVDLLSATLGKFSARPITGTIVDGKGEALPGVSIQVKNTSKGTVSNAQGQFTIQAERGDVLVFSSIGFTAKEVTIGDENNLAVALDDAESKLDEVVVIAYGSESRETQTSAVSSIKASSINRIPTAQLSASLAGRLPGAQIVQSSGFVGSNASITVRGARTAALYVIDNVVADKSQFDVLDPNEVESISVLKDAAAAAIYGARASGGVVVIKTRSGKAGKIMVNYNGIFSTNRTIYPLQDWTPVQEITFRNQVALYRNRASASPNPNFQVPFNQAALDYASTIESQNVNEILWRNPNSQQHSVNVSGGNADVLYFFSANYGGNTGSYDKTKFDKYTLRAKVDAKVSKNLTIGTNISFNRRYTSRFFWPYDNDNGEGFTVADFYRPTFNLSRLYPYYSKPNGTPTTADDPAALPTIQPGWGFNPAEIINSANYRRITYNTFNGIVTADLAIPQVEGLSIKFLGDYRQDVYFKKDFIGEFNTSYRVQTVGSSGIDLLRLAPIKYDANSTVVNNYGRSFTGITEDMYIDERYQTNLFVNYDRRFGEHTISSFIGVEQYQFNRKLVSGNANELLTSSLDQIGATNPSTDRRYFSGAELAQARLSFFGRAKYDYKTKYIGEVSFRNDGSYIFQQGRQFGFFPSVSGAWLISKEDFFRVKPVSSLKIRASYGTTGYDGIDGITTNIAPFQFQNNYNPATGYVFANSTLSGLAPQNVVPNPNITWSINKTFNGGLDMGFLNNALTLSFDYFTTRRSRLLVSTADAIPGTFGAGLPATNVGEQQAYGFELAVNYANRKGAFDYSIGFNMGFANDKYIAWPQVANLPDFQNLIGTPTSGVVIGYISKGIVRSQAEIEALPTGYTQFANKIQLGNVLIEDMAGDGFRPGPDGKVDANDRTIISRNGVPRINFGLPIDLAWKNLSLNVFFQGVGPYDKFVSTINSPITNQDGTPTASVNGGGGVFQLADRPYFQLWTDAYSPDTNPNGKYPAANGSFSDPGLTGTGTTFWKRNGAYVRLKNVNIAYALPKPILDRIGIRNLQVSLNMTNLLTLSAFKEHDPEQASLDSYPIFRTFSLGLNLSL